MPLSAAQRQRNVLCLGADMTLFMMAVGLISPLTLVPLFVSKLTDSPLAIGALTAAFQVGWLPQVLAAGLYERSPTKRRWLIGFSFLERLPALALAACALLASSLAAPLVLALVYLARFSQTVLSGPASTAWLDYVSRAVPEGRRGGFLGASTTLGNLLGAATAALAAPLLLDRLPFPYGFAACFGLGAAILLVGFLPLCLVVDPPGPPPRPARPWRADLAELAGVLCDDLPYRRFLVALSLATLGTMGAAFVVVYGVSRLGAPDDLAAWYTAALLLGQVAANLALGWLGDRRGFGAVGRAATISSGAMAAGVLLSPSAGWLLAAFALLGVSQSGAMLARMAGPFAFAPLERRPTYIALTQAITSLVAALAPLLGGVLVSLLGYEWMFLASLALSLFGLPLFGRAAPTLDPQCAAAPAGGSE